MATSKIEKLIKSVSNSGTTDNYSSIRICDYDPNKKYLQVHSDTINLVAAMAWNNNGVYAKFFNANMAPLGSGQSVKATVDYMGGVKRSFVYPCNVAQVAA